VEGSVMPASKNLHSFGRPCTRPRTESQYDLLLGLTG
jgi:hypothetical protein